MPTETYGPYPIRNADFDGDLIPDDATITFEKEADKWVAKGVYQSSKNKTACIIENIITDETVMNNDVGVSANFQANFIPKSDSGISPDYTQDTFTVRPTPCRSLLGLFWSYGEQSVLITSGQTYIDLQKIGINAKTDISIDILGDSMDENAS